MVARGQPVAAVPRCSVAFEGYEAACETASRVFMRAAIVHAAATLAVLAVTAAPAAAQSFLEQLFGFGAPKSPPMQSAPPSMTTPGGRAYTLPSSPSSGTSRLLSPGDDDQAHRSSGGYKTICVRMCDGFYFPVSNHTVRKGFYRDQMRCRAQCGEEGRLFYLPAGTTEVDAALDLQGKVYGRLQTAYVYRKTLVSGCQCRPNPWSEAEAERHRQYADAEAGKKAAGSADAEPADAKDTAGDDDTRLDARERQPRTPARPAAAIVKATPRPQPLPRPPMQPASAPGGGGGFGGGQLVWPGDAPRRP